MWTGDCAIEGCGDFCLANFAHVSAAGGFPYSQAVSEKFESTFACYAIAEFIAFVPDFDAGEYDFYGEYTDYNIAPAAGAGPGTKRKLKVCFELPLASFTQI